MIYGRDRATSTGTGLTMGMTFSSRQMEGA